MKYGYARVSTAQQKKDGNSLEEQRNQLWQEGCDFIVEEQFTGARMDRPKFQRLCSLLEKGGHTGGVQARSVCQDGGGGSCHLSGADAEGSAHPHPQHGYH